MSEAVAIISIVVAVISAAVTVILALTADDANVDRDTPKSEQATVTQQKEGATVPIVYGQVFLTGNIVWWTANKIFAPALDVNMFEFRFWQVLCMGQCALINIYREGATPSIIKWDDFNDLPADEYRGKANYDNLKYLVQRAPAAVPPQYWGKQYYYSNGNPDDNELTRCPVGQFNLTVRNHMPDNGLYYSQLKNICSILTSGVVSLPLGNARIPTYKFVMHRQLRTGLLPARTRTVRYAEWDQLIPWREPPSQYDLYEDDILTRDDDAEDFTKIGSNPACVIYDLLTNDVFSLGLSPSRIDLDNFRTAAYYYHNKRWGLNFIVGGQVKVIDIINKIQNWVNCYLIKNAQDKYQIKLLLESDANNPTAIIDIDEDGISFTLRRKFWGDTYNSFTGNYRETFFGQEWYNERFINGVAYPMEAFSGWENRAVTVKNEANIALTGEERPKIVDLTCFSNADVTSQRLDEIMKQESYPFSTGEMSTNLKYGFLVLGDVIRINSKEYNISALFRVLDINISEIDKNKLTFGLVEMREILSDSQYVIGGGSQGGTVIPRPPPVPPTPGES